MKFITSIVLIIKLFECLHCELVEVNTTSGLVRGKTIEVLGKTVNQFLSIPYAEPPLGDLRFARPKPIEKPSDVSFNLSIIKLSMLNRYFRKWSMRLKQNMSAHNRSKRQTKMKIVFS